MTERDDDFWMKINFYFPWMIELLEQSCDDKDIEDDAETAEAAEQKRCCCHLEYEKSVFSDAKTKEG